MLFPHRKILRPSKELAGNATAHFQEDSNKPTSGQFLKKIQKKVRLICHIALPKTKIAPKQLPKDRLLTHHFFKGARR